ncbi:hypothetical protein ACM9HF_02480 [Colwellia sp. RE-S-Sl-9]
MNELASLIREIRIFSACYVRFSTQITGRFSFGDIPDVTLHSNGNRIYSNKNDLLFRRNTVKLKLKILRLKNYQFELLGGNQLVLAKQKLFSDTWTIQSRNKDIGTYEFKVSLFPWEEVHKIYSDTNDQNIQEILLFVLCYMYEISRDCT